MALSLSSSGPILLVLRDASGCICCRACTTRRHAACHWSGATVELVVALVCKGALRACM
jgi:hypothetical protein